MNIMIRQVCDPGNGFKPKIGKVHVVQITHARRLNTNTLLFDVPNGHTIAVTGTSSYANTTGILGKLMENGWFDFSDSKAIVLSTKGLQYENGKERQTLQRFLLKYDDNQSDIKDYRDIDVSDLFF